MARLEVKVIPKSGRSEIKMHGSSLKVWLKSAPEKGRANEELRRILAIFLKIPVSAIAVAVGATSRKKLVDIEGISVEEIRQKLGKIA